ncbi:FimV/HubP family polar landmark protein [Acinetobacter sp. ANC 4648]|uniref:FimV/HubP family polar landmark protein n=1 Tax=Acinetobacter sp. ANC 4648 TaxID=1977875 RepID=UPI000A32D635|nr:FimV/HubP family polar landmark protein [Acinetobacter sp. ANC 4648]OTG80619.1 hypothetical protein B9T27_12130 [Acinetobacter sp. ANC 4648]
MTVYNKLKIAILTILSTQSLYAITLDPVQIHSGTGELLYAEMKFSHADPNSRIDVSLADPEDLMAMGITHQPPGHLNFFTRRSADGSGVIVITSSRPVIESELNILLKIKEGNATRIQQIKTPFVRTKTDTNLVTASNHEKPLTPQIIVSEKDIALNLPTSMQYHAQPDTATVKVNPITSASPNIQTPLAVSIVAPPILATNNVPTPTTEKAQIAASLESQNQSTASKQITTQKIKQADDKPDSVVSKNNKVDADQAKQNPKKVMDQKNTESNKHVVQANESLWKIASRIAAQSNQSIPQVMQQIKANNAHAFIQGDINRMRQGVALNLAAGYKNTQSSKKDVALSAPVTQRQSGKEKYKLNQAEMSLVAGNEQDSAHGSAKKETQTNPTSSELSLKVMTAREKTVKLQKNVSKLTLALQQKDQRIQLLNARLAQLQQQLQQQNLAKKPTH